MAISDWTLYSGKMADWKTRKLEECLNAEFIDISGLKRQCWNGIPQGHRSRTWKILLGYASSNTSRRSSTISKRRSEYHQRYVQYSTQALSNDPQHIRLHQCIQKDVLCTAPSIHIFGMIVCKTHWCAYCTSMLGKLIINELLLTWLNVIYRVFGKAYV